MRILFFAALAASASIAAVPAAAQYGSPAPVYYQQGAAIPAPPAMVSQHPPQAMPPRVSPNPPYHNPNQQVRRGGGNRWGGAIGGRWWGGSQAPGGWGGYRRPSRGWSMPAYWMRSDFRIPDYYSFGLRQPGNGYFWVRYYDDAVLVDSRGRVIDWTGGIAWDDFGDGYADYGAGAGYSGSNSYSYSESNVQIARVDPNQYYNQAPGYPAAPYPGGYAPPAAGAPPAVQVQGYPTYGYGQGYGASYGGSSYYGGGGYYAGGGATTTVVIQPAPIVTTTIIEEVIEEEVVTTTTYVTPKRTVRRPVRKYKPKPRPAPRQCGCQCVCR